jgi:hypothetical protein
MTSDLIAHYSQRCNWVNAEQTGCIKSQSPANFASFYAIAGYAGPGDGLICVPSRGRLEKHRERTSHGGCRIAPVGKNSLPQSSDLSTLLHSLHLGSNSVGKMRVRRACEGVSYTPFSSRTRRPPKGRVSPAATRIHILESLAHLQRPGKCRNNLWKRSSSEIGT